MDEKGLEVFLAIAMTKNFGSAAHLLNLTQSTVSHRLQVLENEWGGPLFYRQRGLKDVLLTPGGEKLLPLALKWQQISSQMNEARTGFSETKTLSIGGLDSVKNHILLPFLRIMRDKHPDVHIQLFTGSSTDMYNLISQRQIDIAFVQFELQSAFVLAEPFCREDLVPVFHKGQYRKCNAESFSPKNELAINWGTTFMNWHDEIWGASNKPGLSCDTLFEMKGLMTHSDDWAFIPQSSAHWFLNEGDFELGQFIPKPPVRTILLITHTRITGDVLPIINDFKSVLKDPEIRRSFESNVSFN